MPSADWASLLRAGSDFVMGATPSQFIDPTLSRGVPNPFGARGWEPNTEMYDPASDPLMAGSRKQVTGVSEFEHQDQEKAAADAMKAAQGAGAAAQGGTVNAGAPSGPVANGSALSFINAAKTMLGKPYVWGGSTAAGVDCSGLIYLALNNAGVKTPRLTAAGYSKMGTQVAADQARAGDLVYWADGGAGEPHIGIYLGGGKVLQSPETGDVTKISNVWGHPIYKRILNDGQFGVLSTPTGAPGPTSYGGVAASTVFQKPQVGTPHYELGISSPVHVNPAPAVHGTPM